MNATAWRTGLWRVPILLGALTLVGLLSALIGDDAWDALSWITLGIPIVVGTWFSLRR